MIALVLLYTFSEFKNHLNAQLTTFKLRNFWISTFQTISTPSVSECYERDVSLSHTEDTHAHTEVELANVRMVLDELRLDHRRVMQENEELRRYAESLKLFINSAYVFEIYVFLHFIFRNAPNHDLQKCGSL